MKSLIVNAFGPVPTMAVVERRKPERLPGWTLVRLHYATVNQFSSKLRRGELGSATPPFVLGNEASGMVEESDTLPIGTRVAVYGGATFGVVRDGFFQQWASVPDGCLLTIPDSMGLQEAAGLTVNYLTAVLALTRHMTASESPIVLVSGATGGLGHACMQVSSALGARPIGIVSTEAKAEHARRRQPFPIVDRSRWDLPAAVLELTGGEGADLALDPVGGEQTAELMSALRRNGSLISLGFAGGTSAHISLVNVVEGERTIVGYSLHADTDQRVTHALGRLRDLVFEGRLLPDVDSEFDMENIEAAYRRLDSRLATGSILVKLR